MRGQGSAARASAARIGARVEAGMHLPQALDQTLRQSRLEPRDRGFATEIAYGSERWRSLLDYSLTPHLRRPLPALDALVRAILRQGAYQLLKLGLPAYAVVDASTEAAALVGAGPARGLVNAVLRRVAEQGQPPLPDDDLSALALRYAHPTWLVARWVEALGREGAEDRLRRNQEVPALTVRLNRRRTTAAEALAQFAAAGLGVREVPGLPYALSVHAGGDVRGLPGFAQGLWQVQDVGAQAVGEAIGGVDFFLESACGRGTKTLQQAERQSGRVLGVDLDPDRIRDAERERGRLGLDAQFLAADARRLPPEAQGADAVLLDAPCSTLGVLQRRPDVKWRRGPSEFARRRALQIELLLAAVEAARPGGTVTYSVCSQEPEETIEPVREVLARSGAEILTQPPPCAEATCAVGFQLPGMYLAQLRRRP